MTQGHIDREDAMLHAIHPDDLEGILRVAPKRYISFYPLLFISEQSVSLANTGFAVRKL